MGTFLQRYISDQRIIYWAVSLVFFLNLFFKVHSSFSYEIIPILVTEIFHETPGMAGLFIAGLFCASLRSRRACLLVLTFVLVKIVYEWRISVKNSFYWFIILITFYFET